MLYFWAGIWASTLYGYLLAWTKIGLWERINSELTKYCREYMNKRENASVGIIDSQSVKTTKKGALEAMMEVKR